MRARRLPLLLFLSLLAVATAGCRFDPSGVSSLPPDAGDPDPDLADAALASSDADTPPLPHPDANPDPDPDPHAAVWLTTADGLHQLERQPDVPLAPKNPGAARAIVVDEASIYQEIDGFGASLTESSAWLLATRMSPEQRHDLLLQLFDRQSGIGLGMLRLPIGATDFALDNYSYDDNGPPLDDFSIDHDRQWVIPVLQEIDAINPDLHRIAAPWSPPGWMKTSGSMIGGALRPARRAALARYLANFAQAYADEGLPLDAISVQNEPHNLPTASPGMRMEWQEQAAIIKNLLGPELRARGLDTGILVWDHNWDEASFAENVLADAGARTFVAGTAFHCYGGDVSAQEQVHARYPDLGIWLTECSGSTWVGGYAENLRNDAELLIAATRHWARAVLKWNLALDEGYGPQNHGCSQCLGTVTIGRNDGSVSLNAEYFALGHASKFVAPGAHRVGSETLGAGGLEHVAFVNDDGSLVVVVFNPGVAASFVLRSERGSLSYTLPAGALASFYLGGASPER